MTEPGPATILNVDDDEAGRYTLSRTLRKAGFQVTEAATGTEALRLAREGADLVLLDVHLPDLDGFEVCRRLKGDPATRPIPVIHVSASRVEDEHRVEGLDSGADGYLVEPVAPEVLVATVNAMLRLRRAEEEAAAARAEAEALRAAALVAGTAAHEINNPLTIVQGNLQLALPALSGEARARVERALAGVERIAAIVSQLQKITSLEVRAAPPGLPALLDLARSTAGTTGETPEG